MGYALAEEAIKLGAEVTLVSGPVNIAAPAKVNLIQVESAAQMYDAVWPYYDTTDVVIGTAAVADYKPKVYHQNKMKKQPGDNSIELERTKDILQELGSKKTHQLIIGFAAETTAVEEYARGKLLKKNADMIVANNVTTEGAGFGTDTNIVTMFKRDGSAIELPRLSKSETAQKILAEVASMFKKD